MNHDGINQIQSRPLCDNSAPSGTFLFPRTEGAWEGRLDEAVYHLDEATALQPADIRYLLRYARVLFETGEINHANDVLKQIRALDASNTEALFYLANNYAHVSLYEEARQHAMEYLEQAPNGKHAEASAALVELIDLEQEMEDDEEDELIRLHGQAQRQIDKGMLFAAQETLTGLIAQYPTFWPAYNNLAIVEFYLGENDQAFASLERVLEGNPGICMPFVTRSSCYTRWDRTKRRIVSPVSSNTFVPCTLRHVIRSRRL
ncbi:tetratricopeptide repeat protein [Exiguobacterium sp. SL14]|nr:tetratricopeptide repeat protein [Exiguobacterium sp. SL14]MCY1690191.1 tetratricopeptide repeat protein [Exiguobacterium sp. SL14]